MLTPEMGGESVLLCFCDNAETEEDCLQDLESSNLNNQISSPITISDVLSRATAIVVASEAPSEKIVEDPA